MAHLFLCSLGTSPGTTTTATALALAWPRPVLLVEADITKPSSILPGLMRGEEPNSRGLLPLSVVQRTQGMLSDEDLWAQMLPLTDRRGPVPARWERWLLPAFSSPAAAQGMAGIWVELARTLRMARGGAVDVIVDAGRLLANDPRLALAESFDTVLLHTATTLPAIAAAHAQIPALRKRITEENGPAALQLLLSEPEAQGYPAREVAKQLGLPVAGVLPWDPKSASVYSLGSVAPARFERRAYQGAVRTLASDLIEDISTRREALIHTGDKP